MKNLFSILAFLAFLTTGFAQSHVNTNNPYDYVGQHHNAGLTFFAGRTTPTATSEQKLTLLVPSIKDYGVSAGLFQSNYDVAGFVSTGMVSSAINDPNFSIVTALNNLNMAAEANYANQLLAIIQNTQTEAQLYSQIISLEATISADRNLTPNGKVALLCGTATARYSCFYWNNQSPGNVWGINSLLPTHNSYGSGAAIKWWKVLAKDAVGAIAGGIAGSGVGAIVGGAVASANEIINQAP